MKTDLFVAALCVCGTLTAMKVVSAAQRAPVEAALPAPTVEALRQAVADTTMALGRCNQEMGQLQQLSAEVIAGRLVTLAQARLTLVAAFEQANPGQTLTPAWAVADVPRAPQLGTP